MPIDRDDTLKKAEKLLRQGRLEPAIAEYLRVVEDQPNDWATANTLGDLYARAGQSDLAAEQYARIAARLMSDGFYLKAGAILKKLLKLRPEDENVQLNLAEIAQRQGLLADAKTQLNAIAARRRGRGDRAGAADILVRLGAVDPVDFDARTLAARTLVEMGQETAAAAAFRTLYDDLLEKERPAEALEVLREAVRLNPDDQDARMILARAAVEAGDIEAARAYLDRGTAGDDPALQLALLDMELRSGRLDEARDLLSALLGRGPDARHGLLDLAWSLAGSHAEAAFVVMETVADAALAAGEHAEAAALLQEYVARVPYHIPALLKLIDVCVAGGLEATMCETQAQLADAYLRGGYAAEARATAEDLVAREPWDSAHLDRFRRALVMLKVSEPDSVIAERLSGQAPFTARDVFAAPEAQGGAMSEPPPPAEGHEEAAPLEMAPPAAEIPMAGEQAPATGDGNREGEIDITSVLDGGASGVQQPPQEEDADRQAVADQSVQHMTLARTYLEMGLPQEAIGSLQIASKAPQLRFEAASRLGRLYRDSGDLTLAQEWLERAAEAPAPSFEESRAVLYDLGSIVEESGDTARALAIFLELQSEAGDYRDVAARVERLARVETGG